MARPDANRAARVKRAAPEPNDPTIFGLRDSVESQPDNRSTSVATLILLSTLLAGLLILGTLLLASQDVPAIGAPNDVSKPAQTSARSFPVISPTGPRYTASPIVSLTPPPWQQTANYGQAETQDQPAPQDATAEPTGQPDQQQPTGDDTDSAQDQQQPAADEQQAETNQQQPADSDGQQPSTQAQNNRQQAPNNAPRQSVRAGR